MSLEHPSLLFLMQQASPFPMLFSSLYTLGLVVGGLLCLLKRESIFTRPAGLAPSKGSYLDCLLFLWGLMVTFLSSVYLPSLLETVSQYLCLPSAWDKNSPVWTSTALAVCVGLWLWVSFQYQNTFWNPRPIFSRIQIRVFLEQVLFFFLGLCPFLLLLNFFWQGFLSFLVEQHLLKELRSQPIIDAFLDSHHLWQMLLLGCNTIILAPILEELIFRAGLYRFLKAKLSQPWSSLLSSFCFAFLHGNLQAFAPLWFLGWWLNASYEKTNSIWTPIGVHSLFNINSLWMLYLGSGVSTSS